jgi:hypothetical protein
MWRHSTSRAWATVHCTHCTHTHAHACIPRPLHRTLASAQQVVGCGVALACRGLLRGLPVDGWAPSHGAPDGSSIHAHTHA